MFRHARHRHAHILLTHVADAVRESVIALSGLISALYIIDWFIS